MHGLRACRALQTSCSRFFCRLPPSLPSCHKKREMAASTRPAGASTAFSPPAQGSHKMMSKSWQVYFSRPLHPPRVLQRSIESPSSSCAAARSGKFVPLFTIGIRGDGGSSVCSQSSGIRRERERGRICPIGFIEPSKRANDHRYTPY